MALPKSFDDLSFTDIALAKRDSSRPQFTVIYGHGGLGKTTTACYSHDPVILPVGRETGQERMIDHGIPCFENVTDIDPINFVFGCIAKLLKTEHSRKTLIIDNIGTYREAVDEEVIKDNPTTGGKESKIVTSLSDYGYGKGQTMAYPYYTKLLAGIDVLMKKKRMHVILLGHDVLYNINKEDGTYYQRTGINAPAGENTNVRGLIEARAHNVLYMRGENPTINVKANFGVTKTNATSGSIKRIIYTKPAGTFFAKSRVNAAEYYEIEHSNTEEELLKDRSNQSLKKLFEDLYK
jgi:hypothetical protein